MRLLCLDTSTASVTVALVDDGAVVRAHAEEGFNRHGELLAPAVRAVIAGERFDAVAVGLGPGPFTGLRAGIATAAALADAAGVPVYGACSLDLLAAPDVVVVQDARRKEVYWAAYDAGAHRVDGPHVASPADVPVDGRRVVGAGAASWPDVFGSRVVASLPDAAGLWPLVAERAAAGAASDPLTPLYLRRPDAKTLVERGLA
ncbi:MAG TPA: tRNA (adenosine(37)-N6)-threonylcarbamoyltransferase complex dimerization subunit type 1 TsaB [Mycobacteriales bacterium]|nr:tRNA (adenosine(37)-N6)-threonylcarbamoyltransferase complex dimerization subunit type 1 TsaB [Mycobacteriales bacterium]